jgi:hypothetical protein
VAQPARRSRHAGRIERRRCRSTRGIQLNGRRTPGEAATCFCRGLPTAMRCGLSFLFPKCCHADFLVAQKKPGLVGRSAKVRAVRWPGAAYLPRRARAFRSAGDSGPVRFVIRRNRPVVTSSTAVPRLTQRAGHIARNPYASTVSAIPVFRGAGRNVENVSDLICVRSDAAEPECALRLCARGKKNFVGIFPNARRRSPAACPGGCSSAAKRGMFQLGNTKPLRRVFSYQKTR